MSPFLTADRSLGVAFLLQYFRKRNSVGLRCCAEGAAIQTMLCETLLGLDNNAFNYTDTLRNVGRVCYKNSVQRFHNKSQCIRREFFPKSSDNALLSCSMLLYQTRVSFRWYICRQVSTCQLMWEFYKVMRKCCFYSALRLVSYSKLNNKDLLLRHFDVRLNIDNFGRD